MAPRAATQGTGIMQLYPCKCQGYIRPYITRRRHQTAPGLAAGSRYTVLTGRFTIIGFANFDGANILQLLKDRFEPISIRLRSRLLDRL